MKTVSALTLCCFLSYYVLSQDMNITFSATGAATAIDSITALNK